MFPQQRVSRGIVSRVPSNSTRGSRKRNRVDVRSRNPPPGSRSLGVLSKDVLKQTKVALECNLGVFCLERFPSASMAGLAAIKLGTILVVPGNTPKEIRTIIMMTVREVSTSCPESATITRQHSWEITRVGWWALLPPWWHFLFADFLLTKDILANAPQLVLSMLKIF